MIHGTAPKRKFISKSFSKMSSTTKTPMRAKFNPQATSHGSFDVFYNQEAYLRKLLTAFYSR